MKKNHKEFSLISQAYECDPEFSTQSIHDHYTRKRFYKAVVKLWDKYSNNYLDLPEEKLHLIETYLDSHWEYHTVC